MATVAFVFMTCLSAKHEGGDSKLAAAVGRDGKGMLSLSFCVVARPYRWTGDFTVALIWIVPDHQIERKLEVR